MGSTPQWAYLVGPGATIIAFVLGAVVTWATDRWRWKREDNIRAWTQQREDSTRYYKDRLETYATFLAQCNSRTLLQAMLAAQTSTEGRLELLEQLLTVTMDARQTQQKAMLLAEPELEDLIGSLLYIAVQAGEHDATSYTEAEEKVRKAIRKELGIKAPQAQKTGHQK
jgi:HEPN domain-containing protein